MWLQQLSLRQRRQPAIAQALGNTAVARQQTDTQFANLDPEDVRFNFFRWITSEEAFAMGPSRVDPRTGRILDADIIFDDAMLRGYMRDYDTRLRLYSGDHFADSGTELANVDDTCGLQTQIVRVVGGSVGCRVGGWG